MQWVIKHGGLATEESYGRYLAQVKRTQEQNRRLEGQVFMIGWRTWREQIETKKGHDKIGGALFVF